MFCQIISGEVPGHLVLETDDLVAFLDTRPVFKGHVLLVPRTHLETLPDLPAGQRDGFLAAAQRLATAVKDALGAQGSFVAINNTVSQSVPHLHLHVVPRTKGDGLRGFFWPRTKYGDGEAAAYADRLRDALIDGLRSAAQPRRPRGPDLADPSVAAERPRLVATAQRVAGRPGRQHEAAAPTSDAAEHVDEEVPPEVDRRHAGEREEHPRGTRDPARAAGAAPPSGTMVTVMATCSDAKAAIVCTVRGVPRRLPAPRCGRRAASRCTEVLGVCGRTANHSGEE